MTKVCQSAAWAVNHCYYTCFVLSVSECVRTPAVKRAYWEFPGIVAVRISSKTRETWRIVEARPSFD